MAYRHANPPALRPAASRPEELWRWSAGEIAQGVRSGLISATDATRSALARIDGVNPHLNALVEVYHDEALAAAADADLAVREGKALGPLHGVPTAIKVNTDERGHATTDGILAFKDNIAADDAPVTANLRKAGAIFVGRSNTPGFSLRWFTNNDVHGRTLNPWDAARTPGGSSGGAGSAAASGMVHIAHGNDIGGSIRYPAYACGVAGIRPTIGRVPTYWGNAEQDPTLTAQQMAVQGPLARSIADLRLALDAMRGPDPRDPGHVDAPTLGAPPQRPIRVAVVRDVGIVRPAPSVNAAIDAAAGWLSDAGYALEETTLPALRDAWHIWWLLVMEEFRLALPFVDQAGDAEIKRAVSFYYEVSGEMHGPRPEMATVLRGHARRAALARSVSEALARTPLILLPISAEAPLTYGDDITSVARSREVLAANWPMMAPATIGFPALAVPTGIADGLPSGVQLLAAPFREDLLLEAGDIIEARAGTFTPIDPRH